MRAGHDVVAREQDRVALGAAILRVIRAGIVACLWLCLGTAWGYPDSLADEGYLDRGVEGCLLCHAEGSQWPGHEVLDSVHGVRGDGRTPFAEGQRACEACHGPSAAHVMGRTEAGGRPPTAIRFDADEPAALKDAPCLDCHQADAGHLWQGSAHHFEEVACTDCHQLHVPQDPVIARLSQAEVCSDCHRRTRSEFLRPSSHPVRAGNMVCSDCHAPHGSMNPGDLLRGTLNETCYECHAEYRGPFLWEHAPVAEDCSSCHEPHGSSHRNLLSRRSPWMCQECHLSQFHPSSVESGLGVPPLGASRQMLGRDCLNCHTQVHGSNHPSGAGLIR